MENAIMKYIRAIVIVLTYINMFLTSKGKNPIPVSEEELYLVISCIVTAVVTAWGYWKNNSFTLKAKKADVYLAELREEDDDTE